MAQGYISTYVAAISTRSSLLHSTLTAASRLTIRDMPVSRRRQLSSCCIAVPLVSMSLIRKTHVQSWHAPTIIVP